MLGASSKKLAEQSSAFPSEKPPSEAVAFGHLPSGARALRARSTSTSCSRLPSEAKLLRSLASEQAPQHSSSFALLILVRCSSTSKLVQLRFAKQTSFGGWRSKLRCATSASQKIARGIEASSLRELASLWLGLASSCVNSCKAAAEAP